MLYQRVAELYKKFRLMHYRVIFSRIKEKEGSLSATEAFAVDAIYLLGTPTIKQFSDYLGISQPNATYKINSLSSKGYVTKEISDTDRREYRLILTEKYFNYYGDQTRFIESAVDTLRTEYSEADIQKFEQMLASLEDALV